MSMGFPGDARNGGRVRAAPHPSGIIDAQGKRASAVHAHGKRVQGCMSTIAERAGWLRARIAELEARYGRAPGSVTLIGVSKTHPAERVREAYAAGLTHFGESYVQEALPKIEALVDLPLTWHFVGRIQGNKTAAIAASFAWVHGIDRLRIAERLNEQRPAHLPPLDCCIEVKLSGEASKGGAAPGELAALAVAIAAMPRLRLRGLMTLPAPAAGLDQQRRPFALLADCLAGLQQRLAGLDTLSIGMSDDMEAAIAEGATMLRIGTALFGPRGG
jgi:PLP dependent protein